MKSSLPILLGLPLLLANAASSAGAEGPNRAVKAQPVRPAASGSEQRRTPQPPAPPRTAAKPPALRSPQEAAPLKPDVAVLVSSAVTAAESHSTIAAKLRQQISLYGHQLAGAGLYLQQGKGPQRRFRLELKVQLAEGLSSFEQVCTGDELWLHEDLVERSNLTRVDLRRVRAALARRPAIRTVPSAALAMPVGGLSKLLANLQESLTFGKLEAQKLDQLPVWRIEGQWKPAALAALLPGQKDKLLGGQAPDWQAAPAQLPQRVVLTLGQDDLFPYRIEYLREPAKKQGQAPGLRTLVTLELFEVQFGAPIDPQRFVYNPGKQQSLDATQAYLKQLGLDEDPPQDARLPGIPPTASPARR